MESTVHSKAESIVNLSKDRLKIAQHSTQQRWYRPAAPGADPVWCASASLRRVLCATPATNKSDE